jgi:hypothetical protein
LECASIGCGAETEEFGWAECAIAVCVDVRECLGIVVEEGACTNPSDAEILGEMGGAAITGAIGDCTIGCFSGGGGEPACISECVEGDTGLSGGCSDCFGETGSCKLTACIFDCLTPASEVCTECVAANCGEAFEECAGLPFPG